MRSGEVCEYESDKALLTLFLTASFLSFISLFLFSSCFTFHYFGPVSFVEDFLATGNVILWYASPPFFSCCTIRDEQTKEFIDRYGNVY